MCIRDSDRAARSDVSNILNVATMLQKRKMTNNSDYRPPKVWTWKSINGGAFANINRPIAGATHDKSLPIGKHPLQLYSLATPNGVKVTIMLEELLQMNVRDADYVAVEDDDKKKVKETSGTKILKHSKDQKFMIGDNQNLIISSNSSGGSQHNIFNLTHLTINLYDIPNMYSLICQYRNSRKNILNQGL